MLTENVKYPDSYLEARDLIEGCLGDNPIIRVRAFDSWIAKPTEVTKYFIEEPTELNSPSNLILTLTYNSVYIGENHEAKYIERVRRLKVLSAFGDTQWTYRLIETVWEGKYPTTVALDLDTREVLLINISISGLELVLFGEMDESQFDMFSYELNDREPYRIKLAEKSMMAVLDGAEGVNHLRRNLIIELNCGAFLDVGVKTPKNKESF